jgi:hypothetical protein
LTAADENDAASGRVTTVCPCSMYARSSRQELANRRAPRNRPSRQTNELFEVSEFGWVFGTVSATGSCGMPPETDAAHSSAAAPGVCAFVGAIA